MDLWDWLINSEISMKVFSIPIYKWTVFASLTLEIKMKFKLDGIKTINVMETGYHII